MPTSSIFHNFVITDKEAAERFIEALEAASAEPEWKPSKPIKEPLTDPEAIRALLEKRKENRD